MLFTIIDLIEKLFLKTLMEVTPSSQVKLENKILFKFQVNSSIHKYNFIKRGELDEY